MKFFIFSLISIVTTFIFIVLLQIFKWELNFTEITTYANSWYLLIWSLFPTIIGLPLGLLIAWAIKNIPKLGAIITLIPSVLCVTILTSYGLGIIVPPVIFGFIIIELSSRKKQPYAH